ncbi:class C sortase [uncultured Lactobacillus sp.]|uniref:class C sortase n=1 Tax=uncultured Lactobacillus sp. TaxID=153152 RepID=UPI0026653CD5|nr:class C sortase [uncultured Lactobacillus sp.]
MKTKKISLIIRLVVILLGFAILLYPLVSDRVNSANSSHEVNTYARLAAKQSKQLKAALFAKARKYNRRLAQTPAAFYHPSLLPGYRKELVLPATDVMAYIDIPKIRVHLLIYHGTSKSVLGDGIGHLQGTSLPIGGKSTHAVLVGHRGLPSATLFTDLDEIKLGDRFTVTVLDRKISYKVDAIHIVKPNNVKYLQIVKGKDYCTLLTCTPYGINTKRLLIRGVRVKDAADQQANTFHLPLKKVVYYGVVALMFLLVLLWLAHQYREQKQARPK